MSAFDIEDQAFQAEYERALAVVASIEDERRRRIAFRIALERIDR